MEDIKQAIISSYGKPLSERKNWYSTVAEAYNKVRPRYPQKLVDQVVEVAQLSGDSKILEVGCGPATATVAFAQLGCSMTCLEPNSDFFQLAKQNCQPYPHVELQNISFEEWKPLDIKFDAVLAASSFHWISPEVGYPKAANALQDSGYLILLWNKELQPCYEVYQHLSEVYQAYAPSLDRYEDRETQEDILRQLGNIVIDSGQFKNLIAGQVVAEVTYTIDEYLTLLNTYSPYLKLDQKNKDALFMGLRERLEHHCGDSIELSYICAFHIAQKS